MDAAVHECEYWVWQETWADRGKDGEANSQKYGTGLQWSITCWCSLLWLLSHNGVNNNHSLASTRLSSEGWCSQLCRPIRPTGHCEMSVRSGPLLFADGVTTQFWWMETGTCFPRNLITVKKWRHYKWPVLINRAEAATCNWSDGEKFDCGNWFIAICN